MAQLKYQNTHKMAPRGEEENGAIWLEHKTSWAIYVACVKDPMEENFAAKWRILDDQFTSKWKR